MPKRRGVRKRTLLILTLSGSLFWFSFLMGRRYFEIHIEDLVVLRRSRGEDYSPASRADPGGELVLVFLGSSTCGFSNLPRFPARIHDIKLSLSKRAADLGLSFVAIGLALDWNAETGFRYLRKFGRFDEILVGRNWFGTGAEKFIWEEFPGEPATPQLILLYRVLPGSKSGDSAPSGRFESERVLLRLSGIVKIDGWVRRGMPLPGLSPEWNAESQNPAGALDR